MSTATFPAVKRAKGGHFLIEDSHYGDVFTPEDLSDEQIQIVKTATEFSNNEVLPAAQDIEAKKFDVTKRLLQKAGELGLLAVDIPEAYGGLEMDKVTSALIAESLSHNASFSVALARTRESVRFR
jgi:alkylation response protein AidB-like acyl-CoA dehydrogenase